MSTDHEKFEKRRKHFEEAMGRSSARVLRSCLDDCLQLTDKSETDLASLCQLGLRVEEAVAVQNETAAADWAAFRLTVAQMRWGAAKNRVRARDLQEARPDLSKRYEEMADWAENDCNQQEQLMTVVQQSSGLAAGVMLASAALAVDVMREVLLDRIVGPERAQFRLQLVLDGFMFIVKHIPGLEVVDFLEDLIKVIRERDERRSKADEFLSYLEEYHDSLDAWCKAAENITHTVHQIER